MREIKFRGKRIDNGEWVYGWYVKDWEGGSHIVTEFGPDITHCWDCGANEQKSFKVDPKTVGQSSGLRDRNGKEIYECDIVKVGMNGAITEVTFEAGSFLTIVGESRYRLGGWETEAVEVLGNCFDHPHLLKGEGQ